MPDELELDVVLVGERGQRIARVDLVPQARLEYVFEWKCPQAWSQDPVHTGRYVLRRDDLRVADHREIRAKSVSDCGGFPAVRRRGPGLGRP